MAKTFTIERFQAMLSHLSSKGEADLPRSAKHGTKASVENEFIQELINESDDWNLPAKSTLITWISNFEDTSAEIKRAQLEGKPFIGIPQCLKKIGVKGSVEADQDLRSIQHGLLTVGDTIVTA